MPNCPCFKEIKIAYYNYPEETIETRCLGTKEMDLCSCNGDESKCNFYPEVRKRAKEMELNPSISSRLDTVITDIKGLDLNGFSNEETKRKHIISELIKIKKILEKENNT